MAAIRTVNLPRYTAGEVINLLTYLFANFTIMSSFKTVRIDMVSFPTKSTDLTRKQHFFLLVRPLFSPPGQFWKRWNVVGTSGSQRAVFPNGLVLTGATHSAKDNDTTEHFQNRPPANMDVPF